MITESTIVMRLSFAAEHDVTETEAAPDACRSMEQGGHNDDR